MITKRHPLSGPYIFYRYVLKVVFLSGIVNSWGCLSCDNCFVYSLLCMAMLHSVLRRQFCYHEDVGSNLRDSKCCHWILAFSLDQETDLKCDCMCECLA